MNRAEFTERLLERLDLPPEARELLAEHARTERARRDELAAAEAVWTAEMLTAAAELCEQLSAELSAAVGLPLVVKFDTSPVRP